MSRAIASRRMSSSRSLASRSASSKLKLRVSSRTWLRYNLLPAAVDRVVDDVEHLELLGRVARRDREHATAGTVAAHAHHGVGRAGRGRERRAVATQRLAQLDRKGCQLVGGRHVDAADLGGQLHRALQAKPAGREGNHRENTQQHKKGRRDRIEGGPERTRRRANATGQARHQGPRKVTDGVRRRHWRACRGRR